jgi:hypothetical protein
MGWGRSQCELLVGRSISKTTIRLWANWCLAKDVKDGFWAKMPHQSGFDFLRKDIRLSVQDDQSPTQPHLRGWEDRVAVFIGGIPIVI